MLCALFVYSYLLYYAVACFQLSAISDDVNELRSKGSYTSCDLVLFAFKKQGNGSLPSDLKWKSNEEFSYQNNLFDVIEKRETQDSVFLFCLNDEMENELFFYLEKHVKGFVKQATDGKEKSTFKFLLKDFICHTLEKEEMLYRLQSVKPNTRISFHFFSKILSKESPPPECFFIS
ncbi:MAG: hypothetical protein JWO58_2322 [Chitinophagaceae bacterium]|nr:hypothetical protein [Chitinophagaceae bacterium]